MMPDPGPDVPHWDLAPDDVGRSVRAVDRWAETLAGSELVHAFDEAGIFEVPGMPEMPGVPGLPGVTGLTGAVLLEKLDQFAGEHWDFRAGRERNLADVPALTSRQVDAVTAAVGLLGLDGTARPRHEHYDCALMTGGMVRAGIVKPRFLRELELCGITFAEAVFLGGFREFAGDESELARELGVDGDNEVDAMASGMRQAFGPLPASVVVEFRTDESTAPSGPNAWREESWSLPDHVLQVIAAPSSEPQRRRANTADTFRFWAARHATPAARVLVITTPIYVPYQAAVAVEILGLEFGYQVETVAVSETASDLGEHSQRFLPHHQLQELRSAVSGFRSLRVKLASQPAH